MVYTVEWRSIRQVAIAGEGPCLLPTSVSDCITDVSGITVGHGTDSIGITGCTVILCEEGAVVGVDVRGSAPATCETDLCRPGTLTDQVQAILLSGGSAFGLAAASGVLRFLHERDRGFDAGVMRVPLVPAACIFDLGIGLPVWPDPDLAYDACLKASSGPIQQGCIGAGMGATVGKLFGMARATKSGIGTASVRAGAATVGAVVVVNAFGDVVMPDDGTIVAGARKPDGAFAGTVEHLLSGTSAPPGTSNTTIGVVATDATLTSVQLHHLAALAHDGLARVIRPVHTMVDGDTIFSLATGRLPAGDTPSLMALGAAIVLSVERAVVRAVAAANPLAGMPAARFPVDGP